MRISLFAPYGPFSQESGVIYLLGNYLAESFSEVSQLKCNGLFSVCERDLESNWRRDFDSCMLCMADQAHLQKWSGVQSIDASRFISDTAVESASRWLQSIDDEDLAVADFEQLPVFEYCEESFQKRFGAAYDAKNKRHVEVARRMMITVIRTRQLAKAFKESYMPNFCFVASGSDLISKTFVSALKNSPVETVEFRWDVHQRAIKIQRASASESMTCDLLLEGVSNMRSDKKTWPAELTGIVDSILEYLDLNHLQLSLPIAQRKVVGS